MKNYSFVLAFLWLGIIGASAQFNRYDVNNDNNVNIADVIPVVNKILGKENDTINAFNLHYDGIYDISDANSMNDTPTPYPSLSAALTAFTDSTKHKGGMTIRYIDSTTNKYVQYRLMATTFSTNVRDWEGVDDVLNLNSDNLIKSKVISTLLFEGTEIQVKSKVSVTSYEERAWKFGKDVVVGTVYKETRATYANSVCIKKRVLAGETYLIDGYSNGDAYFSFCVVTGTDNIIKRKISNHSRGNEVTITIVEDGYLYLNFLNYDATVDKIETIVPIQIPPLMSTLDKVDELEKEIAAKIPAITNQKYNLFIGKNAGVNNIRGTNNDSGRYNTALGESAFYNNISGDHCTAIGFAAMNKNTTGRNNTAIGEDALYDNRTGNGNVAVGQHCGQDSKGGYNVFIGSNAARRLNKGDYNVIIGAESCYPNDTNAATSMSRCIIIGMGVNNRGNYNNVINIDGGTPTATGQIRLGNSKRHEELFLLGKKIIFNDDGTVTWEKP